jgi:hypothetical protein
VEIIVTRQKGSHATRAPDPAMPTVEFAAADAVVNKGVLELKDGVRVRRGSPGTNNDIYSLTFRLTGIDPDYGAVQVLTCLKCPSITFGPMFAAHSPPVSSTSACLDLSPPPLGNVNMLHVS